MPILTFTYRTFYGLILTFGLCMPVFAWEWASFWANDNQQASQAFAQENYPYAALLFEDSSWRVPPQITARVIMKHHYQT